MKFKFMAVALMGCILASSSGCASIISGKTQIVGVESEPTGAELSLDGAKVGVTPAQLIVKRGSPHTLTLTKEGYESAEVSLQPKLNGWVFGNIAFGGLIGVAIDIATGAWARVTPKEVRVTLKSKRLP